MLTWTPCWRSWGLRGGAVSEPFKETEIGWIPADWEVVPLRRVVLGRTDNRDPRDRPDEVFRYVEISGISGETYQIEDWRELEGSEAPSRARRAIREGDTLFSTVRPYLRNIAQVPTELDGEICSTGFCVLRSESENLSPDFLHFYVLSNNFVNRVAAHQRGSGYPAVSNKVVLDEAMPLPPLPEQRRIAAALRAIQEAIAAQEDVIAAARELKRSLMERLFTYGPGAEPAPTKETEIGEIPEHWALQILEELASVRGGKRLPKGHSLADKATPYPYVRVTDFQNWSVDMSDMRYLTPSDHQAIKRYIISQKDVYISIAGTIGLVGTVPRPLDGANLTENAARIVIQDETRLDRDYLVAYLASRKGQRQIGLRTTKTSQPKLALTRIRQIPLPLPPYSEQREIASVPSTLI